MLHYSKGSPYNDGIKNVKSFGFIRMTKTNFFSYFKYLVISNNNKITMF